MSKKEVIVPADDLVCLGKDKLQELIRCKDCKYYQTKGRNADDWQWCMMNHHYTDEEKYCAWAERAEE